MDLHPLPTRLEPWSVNIAKAFQILSDIYRNARVALARENYNVHQIRFHSDTVSHDAFPILSALQDSADEEGLSSDWVEGIITQFVKLVEELIVAEQASLGECVL